MNYKIKGNILTLGGNTHITALNDSLLIVGDSYPIINVQGWASIDYSDNLSFIWSLGVFTVIKSGKVQWFELVDGEWRLL